jgi:hypothetical protein
VVVHAVVLASVDERVIGSLDERKYMKRVMTTFLTCLCLGSALTLFAEERDTLAYRTFIDYANKGVVKSVVISEHGMNTIEAVIQKDDAELTYYVQKPFQAGEDVLLLEMLSKQGIPHEILKDGFNGGTKIWAAMLPALIMFALPAIVLVGLIIVVIVILGKVSHIERMMEAGKDQ